MCGMAAKSVLGAWLILSPWALGFATLRESMLTAVVSGIVIAALILWTLLTDKDYSARWCDRTAL